MKKNQKYGDFHSGVSCPLKVKEDSIKDARVTQLSRVKTVERAVKILRLFNLLDRTTAIDLAVERRSGEQGVHLKELLYSAVKQIKEKQPKSANNKRFPGESRKSFKERTADG